MADSESTKLMLRIKRIRGQLDGIERSLAKGANAFTVLQTSAACRGALNANKNFGGPLAALVARKRTVWHWIAISRFGRTRRYLTPLRDFALNCIGFQ